MDPAQKWAVACAREALADYGYPERPLDRARTAVIVGNALGGDFHLHSAARILFPERGEELKAAPSFKALPEEVRAAVEGTREISKEIPFASFPCLQFSPRSSEKCVEGPNTS